MVGRIAIAGIALVLFLLALVVAAGSGWLGRDWHAGKVHEEPVPRDVVVRRQAAQRAAVRLAGSEDARQVLFGDLHVHSTFSTDAFLMALPLAGGEGIRPVADACDFARYCSGLDFWSINDHALALTPRRWQETVEAVRQCDAVAGGNEPDVVPFLGWEWTQIGTTPETHYGHKNVVLRDLEPDRIPARPISAGFPPGSADPERRPGVLTAGVLALAALDSGGPDLVRYLRETLDAPVCPEGVPVRELPEDCIERAATPEQLFAKLDDWGHEALVIPHGTTWGYYTPPGSSWDKQLTARMHRPDRQRLVEVYSGHGNSEEYRSWRGVEPGPDGEARCPEPRPDYLPGCWRAGEIIRERCLEAGESPEVCEGRAADARQLVADGGVSGFLNVPGAEISDWGDSGQCRDCFLPSFNYRPGSSVQYMMALSRDPAADGPPLRFRFGFMASSDNHSARPGTGYKERDRRRMTEAGFANFQGSILDRVPRSDAEPQARRPDLSRTQFFGMQETERQASFFQTGGLVAVHAEGRSRAAVWDALVRREVYGTSGPRILLWFDRVDPDTGDRFPMGTAVATRGAPVFQVRAVGSLEQLPGCPEHVTSTLDGERIQSLCGGECYHPAERRRAITRIEVVRIRPQTTPDEPVEALIEDPWRSYPCQPDLAGCRVTFSDEEYPEAARDALYYVRAIEEPGLAVAADPLACQGAPAEDDCLGEVEERAWSSPIFVDWQR